MIEAVGLNLKALKRTRMNKFTMPDIPLGGYIQVKKQDLL
jgi:16S rRNA U516 pseudouridylate synthase RsuA-like enzyme